MWLYKSFITRYLFWNGIQEFMKVFCHESLGLYSNRVGLTVLLEYITTVGHWRELVGPLPHLVYASGYSHTDNYYLVIANSNEIELLVINAWFLNQGFLNIAFVHNISVCLSVCLCLHVCLPSRLSIRTTETNLTRVS